MGQRQRRHGKHRAKHAATRRFRHRIKQILGGQQLEVGEHQGHLDEWDPAALPRDARQIPADLDRWEEQYEDEPR